MGAVSGCGRGRPMRRLVPTSVIVTGIPIGGHASSVPRVIDGDDLCLWGDDEFVRRFAGNSIRCNRACIRVRLCGNAEWLAQAG
jgi:hypothetical protein